MNPNYMPITEEKKALAKTSYPEFDVKVYATNRVREEGIPCTYAFRSFDEAFDFFETACKANACAEMRGIAEDREQTALFIGSLADYLNTDGEAIL